MFGYIRPVKDRLTESEYELFRSAYCGLCHCMKERCGFASRFTLNFDFTFMAMLLSEKGDGTDVSRRCVAHPFKARKCRCCSSAFNDAADMSVILSYMKLDDNIRDERFPRSIPSRLARLCLRRGYKRACGNKPGFAAAAKTLLSELEQLENEGCGSIDRPADKFALILAEAASVSSNTEREKVLRYLFYHIGRIIYIIDAVDDLPEDLKAGSYNAVSCRFALAVPELDDETAKTLDLTIRHSINLIASDYQLLSETEFSGILTNIIYLGLPAAASEVLRSRLRENNLLTGDKE